VHPRAKFRLDLHAFLQTLQQQGHEIILMGDFNEVFGSDPSGMMHIASSCTIVDILHRRIGTSSFSTFEGGRSRIAYVLMWLRTSGFSVQGRPSGLFLGL
jgi:hypothetical protein